VSTRALAWTAFWFALLVGLLVAVGAHRFGYFATTETPQWEFRNVLLDCKPGTVVQLSPGRVDQPRQRFWFLRVFNEPAVDDLSASYSQVGRYAHFRAAVSEQRPREDGWYFQTAAIIAFRQLGAVGATEWLTEIGLVRERTDTGAERTLLEARFANAASAQMIYSYDPSESREQAARRGLGWVHMVQQARAITSEVYFLEPAGFQDPPPPRDDKD